MSNAAGFAKIRAMGRTIKSIKEVLAGKKSQRKYISREFQDFGVRLAVSLSDMAHKSLYIKLAKEENRTLLQKAWEFVKDAKVRSKAKLFMWKLKKLREGN